MKVHITQDNILYHLKNAHTWIQINAFGYITFHKKTYRGYIHYILHDKLINGYPIFIMGGEVIWS